MRKKKGIIIGTIISIVLVIIAVAVSLSSTNALYVNKNISNRKNNYNTGILSITAIVKALSDFTSS